MRMDPVLNTKHTPTPIIGGELPLPDAAGQRALKELVLAELARHPFRPPWWLRNAHVQTVYARYGRNVTRPPLRVERWDTPDDDFIDVYFLDGDLKMPTAVLLASALPSALAVVEAT